MVFLRVLYALTVIAVGMALIADGGVMIAILAILAMLLMEGAGAFRSDGNGR
jgi:hypothetical protein